MNRKRGILAAGTFTGLVLIAVLALGFGNLQAKSTEDVAAAPTAAVTLQQTNGQSTEEALQAWQDYSAQLEQTVRTLQERDAAYQQQLAAANQTILQLQDQINNSNLGTQFFFGGREANEHEEHEGFGFGSVGD